MNDSTGHESCRTTPDAEDALAAPEIVLSHGHQPNSLNTVGSLLRIPTKPPGYTEAKPPVVLI
jgi:hypothetical protein